MTRLCSECFGMVFSNLEHIDSNINAILNMGGVGVNDYFIERCSDELSRYEIKDYDQGFACIYDFGYEDDGESYEIEIISEDHFMELLGLYIEEKVHSGNLANTDAVELATKYNIPYKE
ncbi:MAG: hypothetical protein OXE99_05060 [Cellvibrionales bacterium]|nr:hypothetical protein [Cellvibrionales bacterium]